MAERCSEGSKVPEQELLCQTHNLLCTVMHNISYLRGLFPEKCFDDHAIPALDMIVKKLMPMSDDSTQFLEWIDKGVCDALNNKCIKALFFCIFDEEKGLVEEYSFSFSYPTREDEVIAVEMTCTGRSNGSTKCRSNATKIAPDKMRQSARKIIRELILHMTDLDHLPQEPIVQVKLLCNYDVDFKPPLPCNEAINIWNKNALSMEGGDSGNIYLALSLKIKSFLCTFDDNSFFRDDNLSMDNQFANSDMICNMEALPPKDGCHSERFLGNLHEIQEGESMALFDNLLRGKYVNGSFCQVPGKAFHDPYILETEPADTTLNGSIAENKANMHGYLLCASARKVDFFLDSGASRHICRDRFCLHNFKKLREKDYVELTSADRQKAHAKHTGDIVYHNITVHNVIYSTKIGFNVISVAELDKEGLMTCIGGGKFNIYDVQRSSLVAEGVLDRKNNDYLFCTLNWWLPKKDRKQRVLAEDEQPQDAPQDTEEEEWIIDSLCARHMVPNINVLSGVVSESQSFRSATGTEIKADKKGNISMGNIVLSNVLYCPEIEHNLMSVGQLDKSGYSFTFFNGRCQIQRRDTLQVVGYGILDIVRNKYLLKEFTEVNDFGSAQPVSAPVPKKRRTQ